MSKCCSIIYQENSPVLFWQWCLHYLAVVPTLYVMSKAQFLQVTNTHPNSFRVIQVSLCATFSTFQKFFNCSTRENKKLHLYFANLKIHIAHLSVLHYKNQTTLWLSSPPTIHSLFSCNLSPYRLFKKLSQVPEDGLQVPLSPQTKCAADYTNYCVENVISSSMVKCFPNNNWITSDLKKLMNIKQKVFRERNRELLKIVQKKLKKDKRARKCAEKTRKQAQAEQ